ncbi:MAG: hypothetical protein CVV64_09775 [Candidatus Wallbacteria bacterium HGW-Wallbacteria-1]|jgi:hypothetical protein|uniref:PqqD family protein n=1 Tax=Candidatus Wallbacteria bacterium HGW-Wallbacteria-1 TaxID=2013854 RepID=A0A2N1PQL5_9BACT|nr:MAG: hypothetical protein CVV64_09775 [Candidatus Wallbacteria bacterium HGW-Wallbacteria-1]
MQIVSEISEISLIDGFAIPVRNPKVAFRVIRDEAVLLDLSSSLYYSINPTGSLAWELMDGKRNLSEIARGIEESFEEVPASLFEELQSFTADLVSQKLVSLETGSGSAETLP